MTAMDRSTHGHSAQLLEAAGEIAARICREAICTGENVRWRIPSAEAEPTSPFLYAGTTGVALFLAACHRVLGGIEYRETALRALATVHPHDLLASPERDRIGGIIGFGSLVWSFLHIGLLLEEPPLIQQARRLSEEITPERVAADESLDVLLGSAGAILALLAIERHAPTSTEDDRSLVERARVCSRHLLARRISYLELPRSWAAPARPPCGGFAHGASGICYALLRLYERTHDPELWDGAQEGFAFERALYSPEHRNWRDFPDSLNQLMLAWCYGAPGILLARLGTLDVLDNPQVQEEIGNAVESTRILALTPTDHLCCGNAGRVEILLYAARKLGSRELLRAAVSLAAGLLRRANKTGHLRLSAPSDSFDPGFFKGASGVGYTLLRLVHPEALPCPLLLE